MMKWICIIFAVFLVSCSKLDTNNNSITEASGVERIVIDSDEPKYTTELEQVFSINQLEEEHIASVWGMYEDEDQNVYLQDYRGFKVHQYSEDGDFIKSFGKEGKGPGELSYLTNSVVNGGQLLIVDDIAMKVLVFDTDTGDFQSMVNIRLDKHEGPQFWAFEILPESDSTFVVKPSGSFRNSPDSLGLFRYWMNGEFNAESIFNYKRSEALEGKSGNGRFWSPTSFTAKSVVKMKPEGGWVYADASIPDFHIYDAEGKLIKVLTIVKESIELTGEHISHEIESSHAMLNLERNIKNAESVPDVWPIWDEFLISRSGNIWVEMNINPPFEREWWIISQEGGLLSKFSLPDNTALRFVSENHLITSRFPEGIMQVDRYQMKFNPVSGSN